MTAAAVKELDTKLDTNCPVATENGAVASSLCSDENISKDGLVNYSSSSMEDSIDDRDQGVHCCVGGKEQSSSRHEGTGSSFVWKSALMIKMIVILSPQAEQGCDIDMFRKIARSNDTAVSC